MHRSHFKIVWLFIALSVLCFASYSLFGDNIFPLRNIRCVDFQQIYVSFIFYSLSHYTSSLFRLFNYFCFRFVSFQYYVYLKEYYAQAYNLWVSNDYYTILAENEKASLGIYFEISCDFPNLLFLRIFI